jgi:hypothetical protein
MSEDFNDFVILSRMTIHQEFVIPRSSQFATSMPYLKNLYFVFYNEVAHFR